MTENTRRVVVTGLGLVSPVGSALDKAWGNIKNGVSGIRKIESFDASSFSVKISGSVIDFNADDYISPKDQKKMDTFIHYGIGASVMAINDSGLEILSIIPCSQETIWVKICLSTTIVLHNSPFYLPTIWVPRYVQFFFFESN